MNGNMFSTQADAVNATLNTISDSQIHEQVIVPIAMTQILPIGMIGLFCAVMIAAE